MKNDINPLSIKKLKTNYEKIKNYFSNFNQKDNFKKFLLEKVLMTYIKTDSLDEAFVLFDSQNTRGKPLKRKDILKVHHIHPIKENRQLYAKKWEQWENNNEYWDILDELFYYISFVRKGIKNEIDTDDFDFIDVFKELKTQSSNYELNNYNNQPPIYENFEFDFENNEVSFITKPIQYKINKILNGIKYLPFKLNSSIVGGEKFFMYVWKYFEVYNNLLKFECFRKLDSIYGGNRYLKILYKALLLFYYDKFEEKLDEFAKRIYILLLYFRLSRHSVRKDGVKNFIKNDINIFELILKSYSIEDVFKEIDKYIRFNLNQEKFEKALEEMSGVKANFLIYKKGELLTFIGDLK